MESYNEYWRPFDFGLTAHMGNEFIIRVGDVVRRMSGC